MLVGLAVFGGCRDDPISVHVGAWRLTVLRALPSGVEATFLGDLNENGQALWHEGEQAVLWDNGSILEVPVGRFLGSSGEVVGDFSVLIDGQLTELPGYVRGITEDGTIYLQTDTTLSTWKDGVLTETNIPYLGLVGPEGRIWLARDGNECGFFLDGEWHSRASGRICSIGTVEENGWAVVWTDAASGYARVVGPETYSTPAVANHVNSHGHAVLSGTLMTPEGDSLDLSEAFPGIRLGAINDDGEILAQLDNQVVLLTPR